MDSVYLNLNVVGSDETGVGDYLTPLVACAALVPEKYFEKFKALGVVDSKKLSDRQITKIASQIKPLIKYSLAHLTQKGYNKLNKSFNAHELKTLLHFKAIGLLQKKVDKIDLVIIDQFATEKNVNKYLKNLKKTMAIFGKKPAGLKFKYVKRAESEHISVAAASILARDFLLQLMKKQNQKWSMTFALGTSEHVEKIAIAFVEKHGKNNLVEVAKLKFKTTEKLFNK